VVYSGCKQTEGPTIHHRINASTHSDECELGHQRDTPYVDLAGCLV
jgi:hypothetical protein